MHTKVAMAGSSADLETRARVFDEVADAVLVADDDRRYVDVNQAACSLFQRTREEMLRLRIEDVMPSSGTASAEELWRDFLAAGSQEGEFTVMRGEERVMIEYRALARIAPGRHVSILRDVSGRAHALGRAREGERKARETAGREHLAWRAAERARAVLDALVMTAPLGFAYLDRELRFQLVNSTLAAMNGLPQEAHIGSTPMEILPGIAAEFVRTAAEAVLRTGEPQVNLELEGETPAAPGLKRTWVEHWYPVRVGDELEGVGIVVEEVTERRTAEARLRATSELRSRLMAIVSHDLRSPLNAINLAATLISANPREPEKVSGLASRIVLASTRMTRLIAQLLDFVRFDEDGGLALERTMMEVGPAAERAIDEASLAFPDATVELRVEGNTAGVWDEDRLLQVLTNLISNAIVHGERHGAVFVDGRGRDQVSVEVTNRGPIIPPEMLSAVFEPFRRGSGGYTRRGGLGLGLYISRLLVEAHGGTIGVTSSEEAGTSFLVTLPRGRPG
jgi:PAS domain S-box-containing protein